MPHGYLPIPCGIRRMKTLSRQRQRTRRLPQALGCSLHSPSQLTAPQSAVLSVWRPQLRQAVEVQVLTCTATRLGRFLRCCAVGGLVSLEYASRYSRGSFSPIRQKAHSHIHIFQRYTFRERRTQGPEEGGFLPSEGCVRLSPCDLDVSNGRRSPTWGRGALSPWRRCDYREVVSV